MTTEEVMQARGYERVEYAGIAAWAQWRRYGDCLCQLVVTDAEIALQPGKLDAVLDLKEHLAQLDADMASRD